MYKNYFGLSQSPFSIAPNPHFLFMSDRHREALSHLTYGLGDTGGFVLLTGEVGTGKTTISRRLLAQLPDNTQSALILNPTLSSQELLATICDKLSIRYRKTGATLKTLTDKIHEKLLKNHKDDINTLLIIDEAQHLQADALEQLRLLTNLETDTKKLLQVILIGQPELQQLLQRHDLRQLAQRITARYHLMPLSKHEVKQYIQHRLSVAQCSRTLFNPSAITMVHRLSKGIPRLINLLCDRALINAFSSNNSVVNKKLVIKSSMDALGSEYQLIPWYQKQQVKIVGLVTSFIMVLAAGIYWGTHYSKNPPLINNNVEEQVINHTASNKVIKTDKNEADNSVLKVSEGTTKEKLVQSLKQNIEQKTLKETALKNDNITAEIPDIAIEESIVKKIFPPVKASLIEDIELKPAEGVSDELLKRFQTAIEQTTPVKRFDEIANERINDSIVGFKAESKSVPVDIKPLHQMPSWVQQGVGSLQFDLHIYASDNAGWVRVNGQDKYQGDKINDTLIIKEILPQKVILTYKGESFSLPALSSW